MKDPVQEQLISARRNQVLDAAAKVFAEKGFHPTTIKDIAKEAGIADGTIYNYFENKTALLLGIFERMKASVIQENMPPVPEELDLRTFIHTFLAQPMMAQQRENFALFRIIISEMMVNEELRRLYYEQILEPTLMLGEAYFGVQAIKLGLSPQQSSLIVHAISAMVVGLMVQNIMGDTTLAAQWEQLPDLLTDLLVNGLKDS